MQIKLGNGMRFILTSQREWGGWRMTIALTGQEDVMATEEPKPGVPLPPGGGGGVFLSEVRGGSIGPVGHGGGTSWPGAGHGMPAGGGADARGTMSSWETPELTVQRQILEELRQIKKVLQRSELKPR